MGALAYEIELNGTIIDTVALTNYIYNNSLSGANAFRVRGVCDDLKGLGAIRFCLLRRQ